MAGKEKAGLPVVFRPEAHGWSLRLMLFVTCSSRVFFDLVTKKNLYLQKQNMATALVTSVTPTERDPSRSGSEDENRGTETEEESGRPAALLQPQTGPAATVPHNRLSKLPLARIKALMKTDPDVSLASQESVFIIAKATVKRLCGFSVIQVIIF